MTSVILTRERPEARHEGHSNTGAKGRRLRLGILLSLLSCLLFLLVGFTHNFIPSESMEPNLRPGDHILTMRSWLAYPGGAMPSRGDIIVFRLPHSSFSDDPAGPDSGVVDAATRARTVDSNARTNVKTDILIKRVVGLPGDLIQVKDNIVYVNGQKQKADYSIVPVDTSVGYAFTYAVYEPLRVPAGQLFVLGDNRANSDDGRFWGTLPRENVIGRLVRTLYHESKYDEMEAALPTRRN